MKHFTKSTLIGILSTHLCFSTEDCGRVPNLSTAMPFVGDISASQHTFTAGRNSPYDDQRDLSSVIAECDANPDEVEKLKAAEQENLDDVYQRINEYIEASQKKQIEGSISAYNEAVGKLWEAANEAYFFGKNACYTTDEQHKLVQECCTKILGAIKALGLEKKSIETKTLSQSSKEEQEEYAHNHSFMQLMHLCQGMAPARFLEEYALWSDNLYGRSYHMIQLSVEEMLAFTEDERQEALKQGGLERAHHIAGITKYEGTFKTHATIKALDSLSTYLQKSDALMSAANQMHIAIEASILFKNEAKRVAFIQLSVRYIFTRFKKLDLKDQQIDDKTLVHSTQEDQRNYALSRSFMQLMRLCDSMDAAEFLQEYRLWQECIMGQVYIGESPYTQTAEEFQSNVHHIKGLLDTDYGGDAIKHPSFFSRLSSRL